MVSQELLNKISSLSNNALTAKQLERKELYEQVMTQVAKFRTHLDEIKDMCEILNHAIANGYAIQCHSHHISGYNEFRGPKLQTDGIDHQFGFYSKVGVRCLTGFGYNRKARYYAVGIAGGGCDFHDVYMDLNGNFWCGNRPIEEYDSDDRYFYYTIEKLLRMNLNYDDFKAKFWDFINNIEKYECFV